ncbi:hypothetical protein FACS1894170_00910 [Planctomycetales bacterium]|nr:hypothetical protein FACS1894170_00910 [Planctomycetales bacterium]
MEKDNQTDLVLHRVQHLAAGYGFINGTLTQQILLLGNAFYGYRFVCTDYVAVWSAAADTIKLFTANGKLLAGTGVAGTVPFQVQSERRAA